ncbi:MAG TPA: phosphatidylglycerophosphatase A [Dissulfurispiraceae bacterium]|nr:phosphatidylglycerophosphatase A [Dissulfurispiraceae bacterium]
MKDAAGFLSKALATVFYLGFIPIAPGTFGTLAAMILIWTVRPSPAWQLVILLVSLLVGIKVSGIAEMAFGEKDCRHIVVDEFVGYLCSIIFLPLTPSYMVAAFLLFRVFDIIKPSPIRLIEQIGGGAGIMLDDVVAGLIANVLLQVVHVI